MQASSIRLVASNWVLLDNNCDVLQDLVPFIQFKKREKHSLRSVNFSKVAGYRTPPWVESTPPWVNTPPWVFFTLFKFYKWHQIAQNITMKLTIFLLSSILLTIFHGREYLRPRFSHSLLKAVFSRLFI